MENPGGLKILHLTTHLNVGGITSYIQGVGQELMKRGHEVTVLSSGGEREDMFAAKGFRVFSLPIKTKNEFSLKILFALPKVIRLVKHEKFDLIHAHTRVTQVLASLVSRFTGVPYMTTAHGYYKPRFGRRLLGCWGKRVVAISPLVAEELEKAHKVSKSKIRVVFNAIDIEEYRRRILEKNSTEIRRDFGLNERTFIIGAVGRLVKDKGHEYLIEAVGKLKKKYEDVFLIIVGDGRENDRLRKLIKKLKLEACVRLVPSEQDITRILSILDVFAHPATFREGFGLVLLEAMVAKIPVVASNIWAINSIIRNHVNGFLVEPKSANQIADAVSFIIENPEVVGSVVQNGYEIATQLYSMNRLANELETVYAEVKKP